MSLYQLGILGSPSQAERHTLIQTISRMVRDFGLTVGSGITVHDGTTVGRRDRHAAFAAVYFGTSVHADLEATLEVSRSRAPIIPCVGSNGDFSTEIPDFLRSSNGYRRRATDAELVELGAALLECIGLLRKQRRVFISYRRIESRAAAMQLHDLMTSRGFDVFLDTHDIRPGDPFQDVLWHRLCDSDVVVMLDTPSYFESKWTRQEIGRARAKEIHVLRVVWPAHTPSAQTDMAETIYLDASELQADDGPIVQATAEQIVLAVESLRSRSIASRYMSITGRLRAEVERIGGRIEGVGAHRAISVHLPDHKKIWAYPIVGIPTAETLNDVADKALRADQQGMPVLVYDHVGIRDGWAAHLKWLDSNIRTVRAIKVSEAAWTLAAWET
jgi:hypothetical protein